MSRIALIGLIVCGILVGCNKSDDKTSPGGASTTSPSGKIMIAVIPKGTTHVYWKGVEAGAKKAGAELGVDIQWKGPIKEDDTQAQIDVLREFVTENIGGIVVAPLDDQALVQPIHEAHDAKIPVAIIDSPLKSAVGTDYISLVATDNKKGGFMGGEELARVLGGKGKVVLLRYHEHSASTEAREAGFLEAMDKNPGITVIEKDRYGGATAAQAQNEAMNMLDSLKEADGIFCPNESTTTGMLAALRNAQLAGKKKFVGFDTAPELIKALKSKEIDALVAQDPFQMGYKGVKAVYAAIKGEKVDPAIDTGEHLITADNVDSPDIQALLNPQ